MEEDIIKYIDDLWLQEKAEIAKEKPNWWKSTHEKKDNDIFIYNK